MSKILLIDNYDSFTYNLYHYLEELWKEGVEVVRNDALTIDAALQYDRIVVSPGSGLPNEAGNLMAVLSGLIDKKNILGICLGHQALGESFGYRLRNLEKVVHGQSTTIEVIDGENILFKGLPKRFKVGRYHSWVIDEKFNMEGELKVTSVDESGNIMSFSHRSLPIHAVQFHPESVLCEYGKEILENWLNS